MALVLLSNPPQCLGVSYLFFFSVSALCRIYFYVCVCSVIVNFTFMEPIFFLHKFVVTKYLSLGLYWLIYNQPKFHLVTESGIMETDVILCDLLYFHCFPWLPHFRLVRIFVGLPKDVCVHGGTELICTYVNCFSFQK